ncbi:cell division protein FtsX [Deinococcus pimensis]|uniref:cell division protein FtsX n=1 Tax=Deinococcus pimensis TaxID=309888 RepID=UPI000483EF42|nr:ABC transporter permease [Deinococcus pimensis]
MTYHLRQAWLAMRGNLTATLATLTTMVLALVMLGFVVLLTLNVDRALSQLESQVEVAAFLRDGADTERILSSIQDLPQVREATVVRKDAVLAEMQRDYPYVREAAELAGNPFPDTLRVRVARVADTTTVAGAVRKLDGVESVEYGAGYVERAARVLDAVRVAGYVLVALLLAGTLFNILNAVRVAMYARRAEINVMRLLGATRGFIRLPYLIEGLLLGVLGAALAGALLVPGYEALASRLTVLVPSLPMLQDRAVLAQLVGTLAGLGVLVGLVGSVVASGRYLRELE